MSKVTNEMMGFVESAYNGASGWNKAVLGYMCDLLDELYYEGLTISESHMLDGASDWKEYSYCGSGCALVYDIDIEEYFEQFFTDFERFKKSMEAAQKSWLDVQADALKQAAKRILTLDEFVNGLFYRFE